jgi:hypothetical protein
VDADQTSLFSAIVDPRVRTGIVTTGQSPEAILKLLTEHLKRKGYLE